MIDEKKLIERLEEEKAKGHYDSNSVIGEKNVWGKAIDIIHEEAKAYNESVKGDLISRELLIKELNGIELNHPYDDKEDILEKAIGIVDHFPTAYNDGWIPCSLKLPDYLDNVLVCTKNGGRTIAHLKHTPIEWRDMYMNKIEDVIAWKYLDAPYQPKGE